SCTAAPGRPTIVKLGRPPLTSTSTVTRTASTPTTVAEATVAYIATRLGRAMTARASLLGPRPAALGRRLGRPCAGRSSGGRHPRPRHGSQALAGGPGPAQACRSEVLR